MSAWIVLFMYRLGIYVKRTAAGQSVNLLGEPATRMRQEVCVQQWPQCQES
jgi:hypothetical protein